MNPVRICSAVSIWKVAARRATTGCLLLALALSLPVHVVAQADRPPDQQPDQQQEGQAQRNDLAAEIEALKREIEEIKVQLARITALQRLQGEQLLADQQSRPSTAASVPAAPQNQRPLQQRPASPPVVAAGSGTADTGSPTVFVFKDGTRTEAHNYAIVGGTLWIYTDQDAKKYAISYIDVAATTAANASRGNKFQMPETR